MRESMVSTWAERDKGSKSHLAAMVLGSRALCPVQMFLQQVGCVDFRLYFFGFSKRIILEKSILSASALLFIIFVNSCLKAMSRLVESLALV